MPRTIISFSCGRQSCLQAAFQAAVSTLAIHDMDLRSRVGQAILPAAAFQAAFRTWTGQQLQAKEFLWACVFQESRREA